MVTIEEAESKAVEFVKRKKNAQDVKVSQVSKPDPQNPDNWQVKGSTPSEKFIVEVDDNGVIVSFKFEPKPSMHTH